jgi:hypothetical protein
MPNTAAGLVEPGRSVGMIGKRKVVELRYAVEMVGSLLNRIQ